MKCFVWVKGVVNVSIKRGVCLTVGLILVRAENIATVPVLNSRPNTKITQTTKPRDGFSSCPCGSHVSRSLIPEHPDPAGIKEQ